MSSKELDEIIEGKTYPTASVTYNVTSPTGFGLLLTVRRDDEAELFEVMKDIENFLIDNKYTPKIKRTFGGAKPKEVVEGEKCPKCGSPLVRFETKPKLLPDGTMSAPKKATKCSTQRWDFEAKKAVGCDYIKWDEEKSTLPASPAQRAVLEAKGLFREDMGYTEASEILVNLKG